MVYEESGDLVTVAPLGDYTEAEETADRGEDGVPLVRRDETVTVAASEPAERGTPDKR